MHLVARLQRATPEWGLLFQGFHPWLWTATLSGWVVPKCPNCHAFADAKAMPVAAPLAGVRAQFVRGPDCHAFAKAKARNDARGCARPTNFSATHHPRDGGNLLAMRRDPRHCEPDPLCGDGAAVRAAPRRWTVEDQIAAHSPRRMLAMTVGVTPRQRMFLPHTTPGDGGNLLAMTLESAPTP